MSKIRYNCPKCKSKNITIVMYMFGVNIYKCKNCGEIF
jgi:transposase-like protein